MTYSGNRFLNRKEMTVNAQYIMNYLTGKGWTKNAVAGMLGNMETESTINPGIWQSLQSGNMSGGYGLVQWTPATKYINWAKANGLDYTKIDSLYVALNIDIKKINRPILSQLNLNYFSHSCSPIIINGNLIFKLSANN